MIMVCIHSLPIGQIYIPNELTDAKSNDIEPQPLFIIRKATREEYLAQNLVNPAIDDSYFYYEVSTD